MPSVYAGLYQGELRDLAGNALVGASVSVKLAGTGTLATLYTNPERSTSLGNPLPSASGLGMPGVDDAGNFTFFADVLVDYDLSAIVSGVVAAPLRVKAVADPREPPPTGSVTEAMLAFGVATQTEIDAKANVATVRAPGRALTIGLGDSHMRGDRTELVPQVPLAPPTNVTCIDPLWWAQLLSDQGLVYYRNSGKGGDKAADCLARVNDQLVALNPDIGLFQAGTNDINAFVASGTPTFASYKADFAATADAILAGDSRLVIATTPPQAAGRTAQNKVIELWNDWVRHYAASSGALLVDYHAVLTNYLTGGFKPEYAGNDGGSGYHPSGLAAIRMAEELVAVLGPYLPTPAYSLPTTSVAAATNSIVENGLMADAGGAAGVADGWSDNAAIMTLSIVSGGSAMPGNWQMVTGTGAADEGGTSIPIDPADWDVGDVLRFTGRIKFTAPAGSFVTKKAGHVQLIQSGGGVVVMTPELDTATLTGAAVGYTLEPHVWEYEYTVPAGITTLTLQLISSATTTIGSEAGLGQVGGMNTTRDGLPLRLA